MRSDETQHSLLNRPLSQDSSEGLAAQVLLHSGFSNIDPIHPMGGKDGGRDAHADKDGEPWIMAAYFPRGQKTFTTIKSKFESDLLGVEKHGAVGMAFVTNQELRDNERKALEEYAAPTPVEIFHLERVAVLLNSPEMTSVRSQFLGIDSPRSEDSLDREIELVKAASKGRCFAKWLSAGLDPEVVQKLVDEAEVGTLAKELLPSIKSPLVLLVAEAGAGKSLGSERFLQEACDSFARDSAGPIPAYCHARQVVTKSLQDHLVDATKALGDPRVLGVNLVLDGVDEPAEAASEVLVSAREVAHSWPNSRVIVCSRPQSAFHDVQEVRHLPRIPDQAIQKIVGLAAGREVTDGELRAWPPAVRTAVGIPLYALLFGRHLAKHGNTQTSKGQLLAELAETGLSDAPAPTRPVLRSLAWRSIKRGGSAVPVSEVGGLDTQTILDQSRLVEVKNGFAWFPLALMAQWFAAESLAEGVPSPQALTENPADLELWRYPIALLLGNFSEAKVSPVIDHLVRLHPAFASQVVTDPFAERPRSSDFQLPDIFETGALLRRSMAGWLASLGELADDFYPSIDDQEKLPSLALRVQADKLESSWYVGSDDLADIVPFRDEMWKRPVPGWPGVSSSHVLNQSAWAWRHTLLQCREQLFTRLKDRDIPFEDTLLEKPRLWLASRAILGLGDEHMAPIKLAGVQAELSALEARAVDVVNFRSTCSVDVAKLRRRVDQLIAEGIEEIGQVVRSGVTPRLALRS